MSVDIDIIPLRPAERSWGRIQRHWIRRLGRRAESLLGQHPLMRRLGTDTVIEEDEVLTPPLTSYFEILVPNTLSLTMLSNRGHLDEDEYLEDYGRNLPPSELGLLAPRWREEGYSFSLTSGGGRSSNEPKLLIALSCALADTCEGRIILMNDGIFDLGVGIYTPEEFDDVHWLQR